MQFYITHRKLIITILIIIRDKEYDAIWCSPLNTWLAQILLIEEEEKEAEEEKEGEEAEEAFIHHLYITAQ